MEQVIIKIFHWYYLVAKPGCCAQVGLGVGRPYPSCGVVSNHLSNSTVEIIQSVWKNTPWTQNEEWKKDESTNYVQTILEQPFPSFKFGYNQPYHSTYSIIVQSTVAGTFQSYDENILISFNW